ncbi:MAG: hypothetical protein KatS3mg035_1323 [Bacteroidia bacterium]|nr:MAG: hypothetical protein KatS3mg035_1323 [Bacteroidia bacterium]
MKKSLLAWVILLLSFIFIFNTLKAQNFDALKSIQKELDQDYDYYAKADPKNVGAKRLAGKIGILDQGITVLMQKKDKTTFEDVQALTEDLIQETQKYNTPRPKNTQKIAKNLLSELQKLGNAMGFLANDSKVKENIYTDKPQEKVKEKKEETIKEHSTTTENPNQDNASQDTSSQNTDNTENTEASPSIANKNKIKIYDEPIYQSPDLSLVYAAMALLFLMVIVMWFSLNNAVKKISTEMRERFKEHDREIESLEKILLNSQMSDSRLTNYKEEVNKRFDSLERSTTMLLMEADKRLSNAENEIKLLDKAKLDLAQFEAFKNHLDNFVTKEYFDLSLNSLQEKIKNTESSLKTTAIINSVITTKLTHQFDENKIKIIEALEEFKRKTSYQSLKELIESQLPLLHIAKTLEDCNITAIAKIVQLGFIASYNENLVSPYEKLTNALRLEGIDIDDMLIGRMALSEFNAENIKAEDYLSNNRFRSSDYPNFIAAKYEIENNPLYSTAMPNTVLFILYPTVYSSRQGTKQVIKKGEYVVKS